MKGIVVGLHDTEKVLLYQSKEKQTCDRLGQLRSSDVLHLADGAGSLEVHHITLVTQPTIK